METIAATQNPASPAQLVQVVVAALDALKWRLGFVVFDDVVLDPRLLGFGKDPLPVDDAATNRSHVFERVTEILATRSGNGWNLLNVLDVDQRKSPRITVKILKRIGASNCDPA